MKNFIDLSSDEIWACVSHHINSELNFHTGYCRSLANAKAPTYICKDPFMCKPEEFSLAITALGQNAAEYNHCMYKKGYNVK